MSRSFVVLSLIAACGFSPATNGALSADAGPQPDSSTSSGSGSGSGFGSGSGSGSAACVADSDGDGICDNVDDWPCGAKPSDPGSVNVLGLGWLTKTANENVANQGRLAVVAPNAPFAIEADWSLVVPCADHQMCDAELEIGSSTAAGTVKAGCLVAPMKVMGSQLGLGGASGSNATFSMTLAAPGAYSLRAVVANASSCTPSWDDSHPPDSNYTFATVCVH